MVQKFEYKRATMEDIDELVRTRIIVLRAANKLSDDEDMSVVEEESKAYYRRALETGEHIAYLVYDNGAFVGAGGVSFYQVMPTYHNPTGKKAYIMNMYTAPEYRRQGIAFHTLDLLINDAKKQGVLQIALEATDMGRPLYERYGFVKMEDKMELKVCKGLKKEDETSDFFSFYLDEIERVQKNYKNNEHVIKYTTALLSDNQKKITIDSDVNAMKKWLEVDKFPLAKYPSKFSPTLMQQLAINIAVSEKDRNEKIFSVNGPPGTGKTTLLKEIIASNVVQMAEVLIKYGIDGGDFVFRKVESASNASYTEKYYEIPEEIAKFGILVVSNNNGAVENITLDLPKSADMEKEKTRTDYFDRKTNKEVYFSAVADKLLGKEGSAWGLISARMGRKSYVTEVLESWGYCGVCAGCRNMGFV